MNAKNILLSCLLIGTMLGCRGERATAREVVRPEKIRSWREVYYDQDTYKKLADLWKTYYDTYPSEDAYANWMYAMRYARAENYEELLTKGLKKYPANPTLLYLAGILHNLGPDEEDLKRLERAAELEPTYMDPWFALVTQYMKREDRERTDMALRRILESGVISDDILDYSYNMLAVLDENAILITNGDNDTYPAWILIRILKFRPDVIIANRSLLNTDWYPLRLMEDGAPNFTSPDEIKAIHEHTQPPFSDTLMVRLIQSATQAGRSVYFAKTLYSAPIIDRYRSQGDDLGLVTQVTPDTRPYRERLRTALTTWMGKYRTGGLDSWRLRHAKEGDAGRMLAQNYGGALAGLLDTVETAMPDLKPRLFQWYVQHAEPGLPTDMADKVAQRWCQGAAGTEMQDWCRKRGY